jgi:aspartate carbamoyltransferase catalytic subunit
LSTDPSSIVQRDPEGRLRHLITLEGMRHEELTALLDLAQFYVRAPGDLPARDQSLAGHTVANLFFEPSTRTRVSFELAAQRLGADVVNLDMQSSSRVKGRGCRPTPPPSSRRKYAFSTRAKRTCRIPRRGCWTH